MTALRTCLTGKLGWWEAPNENLPYPAELSYSQLCDLLMVHLAGEPLPTRYDFMDAADLVSRIHLHVGNEISQLRGSLETCRNTSLKSRLAVSRISNLLMLAGKRKTMRTEEVQNALTGSR